MSDGCQACEKRAREVKDLERKLRRRSRRLPRLRPKVSGHGRWMDVVGAGAIVIFLLGRAAAPVNHALIPPELSGCPTHPTVADAPQRLQKALGSLWGTAAAGFTAGLAGKSLPAVAIPAISASTATSASTTSTARVSGTGPALAASAAKAAGWPQDQLVTAVAVAGAESSYSPTVENSIGASGLWQILQSAHPDLMSTGDWRDPASNARMALAVYRSAGNSWTPWVAYTSGAYRSHIAEAQAAVGGTGGGAGTITAQPATLTTRSATCTVVGTVAPVSVVATGATGGGSTGARGAVAWELAHEGIPYLWGGTGPQYDCSGFTQAAYASVGIRIPRVANDQMHAARPVPAGSEQPGDLAFPKAEMIGGVMGHVEMVVSVSGTGMDTFSSEHHTGTVSSVDSGSSADFTFGRVT
jgi:cell wall-associated NlpC family hydrolase